MGSGQSARKLTINNEEIGVIGISESVVERLTQKANEKNDLGTEVRSTTYKAPSSSQNVSPQFSQSGDTAVTSGYVTSYPQLTITALKIQQQKEQELRNQDQYWQKRLENLQHRHAKINHIIDVEYKKAVNELQKNDSKNLNIQDTVQPCKNSSEKVLKCYQDNPKEILKCSDLVEEFSSCVDERRARVIAARC
ncbi:MICOS complex subunit MIC25 [Osmia bicornis bicornis]|uniref:MICOS complex subunit MIC25 n=1 Tax=Osmia bicornis bicornis TaxID=1437191 RepID=UPI0010F82D1D|nr:MICOS complex subunit MIC25 [Osmia bicornis bicornis]XP_029039445.1 MICOS complex subunit MIC25 [Osmia bicornis bicornis]XP_029039447.1 MICOS complex subunit MIC25 [Osmia bicornis bicornis]XP_046143567.1 MICOS complex subunit MIC25 [Osmia bicornis bicornis]